MLGMAEYVDRIMSDTNHSDVQERKQLEGILKYLEENRETFRILLHTESRDAIERDILQFFGQRNFADSDEHTMWRYIFNGTGAFGIIHYWLENDKAVPAERMADIILQLTASARKDASEE